MVGVMPAVPFQRKRWTMPPSPADPLIADGPGSVSCAPQLLDGFTRTFTSRYVDTGEVRLHAVTGGTGPALLLLAGWPQTWYAWRLLMPALARDFQVVALDARGVGLSDKPLDGYDTGTLARDAAAVMTALGHDRFCVAGHDVGMWVGYALAADHPDRVDRLAVAEAFIPGLVPSPPLLGDAATNDRLWHFAFNRLPELNEQLLQGREHLYFGYQFAAKAAKPLPDHAVRHYIDTLAQDPAALRASFAPYRALDTTIAQNERRRTRRLHLPVLAIGGAANLADRVGAMMRTAADDVEAVSVPGGHYPAEEAPGETLTALTAFLLRQRT